MSEIILSFIVPCYNEEDVIERTYKILYNYIQYLVDKDIISSASYISFIDCGSSDTTWEKIESFEKAHGIKLSRNFGHEKAILAGLQNNQADIYIPIDIRLHDDINIVENMIYKYINGVDVVLTKRKIGKYSMPLYKVLFFSILYKIYNRGTFCLLSNKIANEIKHYNSQNIDLRRLIQSLKLNYKSEVVCYIKQKGIC